jgi:oxygen-independent coproporphyrinogen-3 oxidase
MLNQPPLSLYIHLPWCVRKCPYCDFNSHQLPKELPAEQYIEILLRDLQQDLAAYDVKRPLHSIFIGGGTPSLFSAKQLATLLEGVDAQWGIPEGCEITMEANPGTVEHDNFADYKTAGINRLSLGVQSFNGEHLKILGRIHSADEAKTAIETIYQAGITRLNIDLMFGLPKQSIAQGLADLQQAIDFAPQHISWYQLTLEPNTVFYKKPPRLPNEDLIADLYDEGLALLAQHGYAQYEISAYARPDEACTHNLNYWQFGDYLGIGAGAHGKITLADSVLRTRKVRQPTSYLQRTTEQGWLAAQQPIKPDEMPFEYLLNRLRLNAPLALDTLPSYIQTELALANGRIQQAIDKQLLTRSTTHLTKTALGERFLNDLLAIFL